MIHNTSPDDHDWDALPPEEPYDRATELAILREAYVDAQAGLGRPFEEFMAELACTFNFPDTRGE